MSPLATVLQGDALTVLADMPEAFADLAIVDPPYGTTSLAWDVPVRDWLPLVGRALKPSGTVWLFGSLRSLMALELPSEWRMAQDLVWEKHNGSNFHADRFRRVHELIVQLYRDLWRDVYTRVPASPDGGTWTVRRKARPPHMGSIGEGRYQAIDNRVRTMRSVIYARSCHGVAVHPTQKPLEIIRPLIEYSCPPGGVVLDPFAGSGSVAVAASGLGRRSVSIELSPDYVKLIHKRLAGVTPPLPLYGAEEAI